MKKLLVLLFASLLMAAGCGAREAAPPVAEVRMEQEEETYMLEDGVTPALHYSCALPVVTINGYKAAEEAINADLIREKESFLRFSYDDGTEEDRIETMISLAQGDYEMRREMEDNPFFPGYELDREVVVTRNEAPVLSFLYSDYDFTGGAHGLGGCYGVNYDIRTGAVLTLADIAEDAEALQAFCEDQVLLQTQTDEYRYEDGYTVFFEGYEASIPDIIRDGCWYMDDDGLEFIANPYLIAPYAAGILEFLVPYEDVMGLMKAEFIP